MSTPTRALFTGLVDDAAMFPPGNASADDALADHLRYRGSWFADLIGPLLVPARTFETFVDAHQTTGSPEVAIVLIGTTTLRDAVPSGVTVLGFEAPVSDLPLPTVPDGLSLAAEIAVGAAGGRVIAAIAEQRAAGVDAVAKFRTGGTSADAFPSEDMLASVLCLAASVPVPVKLTAGLHHAVRFTDAATGFEHHGFLNIVVAVAAAADGASQPVVAEALEQRDADLLAREIRGFTAARVAEVRDRFVSFGCCGVEDPVNDLVALGLVNPEESV